ncbi:MAG TPA: choice-of-anchor Q domain-containing protein, partial [Polyangiaceae bacterium]|nr:choice-of-anchor Q domain-containing protein [Polyangiaceae bacterium]
GAGYALCKNAAVESSYNSFSDASCALAGPGDQQGEAAFLLGPLASNGGAVPTRMPGLASVLVDRIPTSACMQKTDARGVPRPQAAACDVGAVEVEPAAGTGASDLSLTFTDPPVAAEPGRTQTWNVTLTNRGPGSAQPSVSIAVPDGVHVTAASAPGAACTTLDPLTCVWSTPLPSGSAATITITADVDAAAVSSLSWLAQVYAPNLLEPLADDRAALVTPISATTDIRVTTRYERDNGASLVTVELFNSGPASAIGTAADPIALTFNAAPGVRVTSTLLLSNGPSPTQGGASVAIAGTFGPGDLPFATVRFAVRENTPALLRVGTIQLVSSGVREQTLPPAIPVIAADLELRAFRPSAQQATGDAVPFTIQVRNNGPATATNINVSVFASLDNPDNVTFSAPVVREPYATYGGAYIWPIASLASGASVTLTGSIAYPGASMSVGLDPVDINSCLTCGRSRVGAESSIDLNPYNDFVNVNASTALEGTADLQVTDVSVAPGSSPELRKVRVTAKNAGPFATQQYTAISLGTWMGGTLTGTVTAPTGWECENGTCRTTDVFPVGASASVEFEIDIQGATEPVPVSVSTESSSLLDPDQTNNSRVLFLSP